MQNPKSLKSSYSGFYRGKGNVPSKEKLEPKSRRSSSDERDDGDRRHVEVNFDLGQSLRQRLEVEDEVEE